MKKVFAILMLISPVSFANDMPDLQIGKWCETNDAGKSCFGYEIFHNDGKVTANGELVEFGRGYEMKGSWEQIGKKLCITPIFIRSYELDTMEKLETPVQLYEKFCDTVVLVNEEMFLYKNDNGELRTMYRVQ